MIAHLTGSQRVRDSGLEGSGQRRGDCAAPLMAQPAHFDEAVMDGAPGDCGGGEDGKDGSFLSAKPEEKPHDRRDGTCAERDL